MKNRFNTVVPYIKNLSGDRLLFSLYILLFLLAIVFSIQIILAIKPNDLQLVSRYTAFGGTHFYRDPWFYQLVFPLFLFIVAIGHAVVSEKVKGAVDRQFSLFFAWLGVGMIVFAWITANTVLTAWSPL